MYNTEIITCNFEMLNNTQAVASLINACIHDEMGEGAELDFEEQIELLNRLREHPKTTVLLARTGDIFSGILIAFETISALSAKPMINIHNLFVLKEFRRLGIGSLLLNQISEVSKQMNAVKITLELRADNKAAGNFCRKFYFKECSPNRYSIRATAPK